MADRRIFTRFIPAAIILTIITILISSILSSVWGIELISGASIVLAYGTLLLSLYYYTRKEEPNIPNQQESEFDHSEDADNSSSIQDDNLPEQSEDALGDENDTEDTSTNFGLTVTDSDYLNQHISQLEQFFYFHDGDLIFEDIDDMNIYQKIMLYIIAARYAYAEGHRDSPEVTGKEVVDRMGNRRTGNLYLFLLIAKSILTPRLAVDEPKYLSVENLEFSIGLRDLSDAVDWVIEGKPPSKHHFYFEPGYAALSIDRAREIIEEAIEEQEEQPHWQVNSTEHHGGIRYELRMALEDLSYYPIIHPDSNQWDTYVRNIDLAYSCLERGEYYQMMSVLDALETCLENMDTEIDPDDYPRARYDWKE